MDVLNKKSTDNAFKLITKTINNNKTVFTFLGIILTASLPYIFELLFPSLAFKDPSFELVIIYGLITLVIVLAIILAPGIFGHTIFLETKKNQDNLFRTFFYNKKAMLVLFG